MSNKTAKIAKVILVLTVLVVCGEMILCGPSVLSARARLERWLGIRLPTDAGDIHYWYQQPHGYYHADLVCRIQITRDSFIALMKNTKIERATGSEWLLPSNFNSDQTITWWNPPLVQNDRFHQQQQDGWITLVWFDGYLYAERVGNFGSMWGPHGTIHN